MFNPGVLIAIIIIYVGLLLLVALKAEKLSELGRSPSDNALVYSLCLAIYCTTWTYYGSVGSAASSGMLFLTIYLGPTLAVILWWTVLRKLVRIKHKHRITSIADFIAARYKSSQAIAALVTVTALIGIAPYIALQLNAVASTFALLTAGQGGEPGWTSRNAGPVIVVLMTAFTIMFGVRRLDPTEQHQGMMTAVAVQSVFKLVSFLAVGIFASYFLFDGFGDIFSRLEARDISLNLQEYSGASAFIQWVTYLILAMSAIMFLPRQFHVSVVENSDENHIKKAMWLFPLYLFLINLFVLPIAAAGLLKGMPREQADFFVLTLPLKFGGAWLALLAFLGGFSAAMSMIMISAMTMATMITNHLLLPVAEMFEGLAYLRRRILRARWAAVAIVILLGYWFNVKLGESYTLVNIGIISFAAALQFAPAIVGGLFWRRGSKAGAILGLGSGFFIWAYTLLLPSFARSGWISAEFVSRGPFGIELLMPERLLGVISPDPLSHCVFWSMLFNVFLYIGGSVLFTQKEEDLQAAEKFTEILKPGLGLQPVVSEEGSIPLESKLKTVRGVMHRYVSSSEADAMINKCIEQSGIHGKACVSVLELSDFFSRAETLLAGSIGAAAAHKTFLQEDLLDQQEARALADIFAGILADLRLTPAELKEKIDYYQEKEKMVAAHAADLEEKVEQLREQIAIRKKTEIALRKSQERYLTLLDTTPDAVVAYNSDGLVQYVNPAFETIYGWTREELLGKRIDFVPEHEKERNIESVKDFKNGLTVELECQRLTRNGDLVDVIVKGAPFRDSEGSLAGSIVIHHDITRRKRAEAVMIQSDKMMSVGGLAAGMAHEINNPLAGIIQNAQVILNRLTKATEKNLAAAVECGLNLENLSRYMHKREINDLFSLLMESGRRAAGIVDNMLSFSRMPESGSLQRENLADLIDKAIELAATDYDLKKKFDFKDIEIVREYDPDTPETPCESSKIQQVLLNLLSNAAYALSNQNDRSEAPLITIRLHPTGDDVVIEVEDNGPGVPADMQKRVFEPFFTTKDVGQGTGLGLSVSYFIIKENHGGTMTLESGAGRGAKFCIRLPVYSDSSKQGRDRF